MSIARTTVDRLTCVKIVAAIVGSVGLPAGSVLRVGRVRDAPPPGLLHASPIRAPGERRLVGSTGSLDASHSTCGRRPANAFDIARVARWDRAGAHVRRPERFPVYARRTRDRGRSPCTPRPHRIAARVPSDGRRPGPRRGRRPGAGRRGCGLSRHHGARRRDVLSEAHAGVHPLGRPPNRQVRLHALRRVEAPGYVRRTTGPPALLHRPRGVRATSRDPPAGARQLGRGRGRVRGARRAPVHRARVELACEGNEMLPYPYGYVRESSICNCDRTDSSARSARGSSITARRPTPFRAA